jgi:hypothetical protein
MNFDTRLPAKLRRAGSRVRAISRATRTETAAATPM